MGIRPPLRSKSKYALQLEALPACAFDYCDRSLQEDPEVEPWGPRCRVAQVQPNHLIEFDPAPAGDLPKSGDPGFRFQKPAPVPCLVYRHLIRKGRAGTNQ